MPTCNGSSQCLLAVQVTCCFKKAMFRTVKFQRQMLCESETCQGTDLDCSCHQKNQHSLLTTTMESWKGVPTDTPLKPSSSSYILNKLKAPTWLCKSATQQCAMAGSMLHNLLLLDGKQRKVAIYESIGFACDLAIVRQRLAQNFRLFLVLSCNDDGDSLRTGSIVCRCSQNIPYQREDIGSTLPKIARDANRLGIKQ